MFIALAPDGFEDGKKQEKTSKARANIFIICEALINNKLANSIFVKYLTCCHKTEHLFTKNGLIFVKTLDVNVINIRKAVIRKKILRRYACT